MCEVRLDIQMIVLTGRPMGGWTGDQKAPFLGFLSELEKVFEEVLLETKRQENIWISPCDIQMIVLTARSMGDGQGIKVLPFVDLFRQVGEKIF